MNQQLSAHFFNAHLRDTDEEIFSVIRSEFMRQREGIELIASENMASRAVIQAMGSPLTNKYAEGYPGRRYYGGCEEVDKVEVIARDRLKALFGADWVNVQPNSGSQANQAVFLALLKPGDKILSMSLAEGGHLTHGAPVNVSGKWFEAQHYSLDPNTHLIDYDAFEARALEWKPQMIIGGGSAYPRHIDFARMRKVADACGAYFLVDMAHFAGLSATGYHPNPMPHAHVVTSTTHKTLRGPRGGIILSMDKDLGKKFNSAVFPGMQGGPLMHVIAGKAVAFGEALKPEFRDYCGRVVDNARVLAKVLIEGGLKVVSGGTDTHLTLVDLTSWDLRGDHAEKALDRALLTTNKNGVPGDPQKPMITSGIRLGSPAATTRGFGLDEFSDVGDMILKVLDGIRRNGPEGDAQVEEAVRGRVRTLTARFPIYTQDDWVS